MNQHLTYFTIFTDLALEFWQQLPGISPSAVTSQIKDEVDKAICMQLKNKLRN